MLLGPTYHKTQYCKFLVFILRIRTTDKALVKQTEGIIVIIPSITNLRRNKR